MSANVETMMYVGTEVPWHGLGVQLKEAATSAQALVAAGLDWTVEKVPVKTQDGILIPNAFATVRSDNRVPLGVVGRVYSPLQNKDAFAISDSLVGVQEAMYHTAGSLGQGEIVWILAKLPGYVRVVGDDVTEKYLLLTNRHDGQGTFQCLFTPIRVVCQNTLNIALGGATTRSSIRHTTTLPLKVDDIRQTLGIINARYTLFEELSKKLVNVQMSNGNLDKFLKKLGLGLEDANPSMRAKNTGEEITKFFETGKGNNEVNTKGTAWAAFNGVVEYVDYARPTRVTPGSTLADQRTKSLLFGSGAELKQRAWDAALSLV